MDDTKFTVGVRQAWWLTPYFYVLATISALTGRDPDWKKVEYWIAKALKPVIVSK